MHENSQYSELFWCIFSRAWTGYRDIPRISIYSVEIYENMDKKSSECRHTLHKVVMTFMAAATLARTSTLFCFSIRFL